MARKDISELRDEAVVAVERGRLGRAIEIYEELEQLEPQSAAWPKRLGETHRRAGDNSAAVIAFDRAADKYVHTGFLVQAIAVCKMILQLDPANVGTITRLAALAPGPGARGSRTPRTPPPLDPLAPIGPPKIPVVATPAPAPSSPVAAPIAERRAPSVAASAPPPTPDARPRPATRAGRISVPPAIPDGSGLDALELASVVPGSRPLLHADGTDSGIVIVPLDEAFEELDAELEFSLDDAEVVPPVPELSSAARFALVQTPLFAELQRKVLERLIPRMALLELAPDEILFREGDQGTSLFVISEGEVAVEAAGIEIARLGPGAFFGEISLVTDLPRSATVRALGPLELLGIDRDVVRDAAAEQPEIISVLLRFVRDRLVDRMVRTSELFRPFAEHDRVELSARFELVEVVPGSRLIVAGHRADGLYVMVAGRVDVLPIGATTSSQLGSGDVFGEMSLLSGGGSTADVTAANRVLALRMPAATFSEVIMTHPQVLAYLGELAARRSPRTDPAEYVDLHLELL